MEIEVKARAPKDMENRLKKIKAKFVGETKEKNVIYNSKFRDFVRTGEIVRVRESKNKMILTYKSVRYKNGIKYAEEIETSVEKPIYSILEKLGLFKDVVYHKKRREYKVDSCNIFVDHIRGLGKFIEIEVITKGRERGGKKIERIMHLLGIKENDIISASYPELVRERINKEKYTK
ncbi:MAG: class IV adenylate cyclase [Candidatus Diapherotrites archaeon]|nr:class IV adenylate cyclase [Candidatus Diapherotrites archaeon]